MMYLHFSLSVVSISIKLLPGYFVVHFCFPSFTTFAFNASLIFLEILDTQMVCFSLGKIVIRLIIVH